MTFFDKLALALAMWGSVLCLGWFSWIDSGNLNGRRAFFTGIGCLLASTLVWIFS